MRLRSRKFSALLSAFTPPGSVRRVIQACICTSPRAVCKPPPSYRSFKSPLEAGEFIEHAAQSPDITLLVVRLPFTELWGDVAWSSHDLEETILP